MDDPELQARLAALDSELEEGDITQKGYEKRRTLLLAQYNLPLESPGSTSHRHSSFQARTSSQSPFSRNDSNSPHSPRTMSMRPESTHNPITPTSMSGHYSSNMSRASTLLSATQGWENGAGGGDGGQRQGYIHPLAPQHLRNPGGSNSSVSTVPQVLPHSRDNSISLQLPGMHVRNPSDNSGNGISSQRDSYGYPQQQQLQYDYNNLPADYPLGGNVGGGASPRENTMAGYFSDFTAQGYAGGAPEQGYTQNMMNRYSGEPGMGPPFSPSVTIPPPMLSSADLPPPGAVNYMLPLEPRDVPFAVHDPHNPNIPMSGFDNLAAVLRHRSKTNPKQHAYIVLDTKGKEMAAISWEKLASRAEKVAQVIRDKSNLYRGDRVALVYRDVEVIEFAVALLGCFIAGVVAVPINNPEEYQKLNHILTSTQAHLALTTDNNLKVFQRDLTTQKLSWPRGVEWWKTNEFGSFHPKRKEDVPPLQVPDLAYIDFSRSPTGDLRGVVMSHRTIMHQMGCLSAIISTVPADNSKDTFHPSLRDKTGLPMSGRAMGETLVSYLDPRQGIGMIFGVLLAVYGGQTTVWLSQATATTSGLYANVITRYKATLCLADYPALKIVAYNYQNEPMVTRNYQKKLTVDFSTIRFMLIDALTVDAEFHEILADRWLRPLKNTRARDVVAPMLCLPEHGGMVISMRDWLGGEERMGCALSRPEEHEDEDSSGGEEEERPGVGINGYSSLLSGGIARETGKKVTELTEVLLDKEALKTNDVIVLAIGEEAQKRAGDPGTVRVGTFGYPIPDATLAVVDPETFLLCSPNVVGEIWVDSPSLSGGFWALPKQTESIFHARPYKFEEGNPNPVSLDLEFLRTGLLGCVIEGKIFVLGLYEDRLRQKVEWVEEGAEGREEFRCFFVQHLVASIMKNIPKIFDCSAFDVFVNDEHLPIILLESQAASTAPTAAGGVAKQLDIALLDQLSERCMDVLLEEHHLRVYCVMITAPNTLPRVLKNGRREIGNILCNKEFGAGTLPCVHVKFGVHRAVLNLPIGIDPSGGIWSPLATQARQEILMLQEKQYSGVDYREVVIDDRTSTPLTNFSSIVDLLQWRVARQSEELSYCTIDTRGKEGKGVTWKKLDTKIAAVASMMKNKWKIKSGDHVILIYTHSEDFVYAIHACFCLGVVAVPLAPLDQNRLPEDVPALLHMIKDFDVKAILVNAEVDHLLKSKPVSTHMKQTAAVLKAAIPPIHNTAKPPKSNSGCRDLGFTMKPAWVQPGFLALVWTYWTPDQRRIAVGLGHDTIMGICKVMKETCQMTSSRPVVGCVRSISGVGFVYSLLMGVFVGAPTYLVSPIDFAQNPHSLFLTLSRYKIKDTYATPQMLDHAILNMPAKGFTMHELKNMMIACEGRPRSDIFQRVRLHFAGAGLDRTAINTIYSHVLNPMIASRSYMCIEPIELWLDPKALRRGLVYPVDADTCPNALLVQDSGMVPVSTQVAIVNPETSLLCHTGEYGEIWVESEACVKTFYGSNDPFDVERFNGKTADGDPRITYVRTGDLGFLHTVSRPIGPGGAQVEMQILFVLGAIGETFEVNGLSHFPVDIEYSVERCHRNIVSTGSAVFQAGGLVVVLVEVKVKSYLASMVPVIVNAILDQHQLVVDIVAFVGKGDFPRSRLGEKQRGKILASWVQRKMRTIAQFGIRDTDRSVDHHDHSDNMGGRPSTVLDRTSTIMNEKAPQLNINLPVELADNELNSPVELPTHYGNHSPTPDEGRSEHHQQWTEDNSGYGIATSTAEPTPPPKSRKRPSISYGSTNEGGLRPLMVVGAEGTDRPHSDYDQYPTEAIMHMQLNDPDTSNYGQAR
ncbi:uncharacterized protein H6S33_005929 [Morchella sextelata]|uniref:uncharacterized protein n=1 Tax=Morchella sextelata TaxID=1174677 RepID=UPI001D041CFB|nr:uncharacterized protein H6S33_005929 [Morchella sextelata]KAH0614043.1 hypothetical protein H6S33_005929 [Morchella sextelata]